MVSGALIRIKVFFGGIMKISFYLTFLVFITTSYAYSDSSKWVYLCYNDADKYVVEVDSDEDCRPPDEYSMVIKDEEWHEKISGGVSILSSFAPNEECDTEGVIRNIGLDENGNGVLDESEVRIKNHSCKVAPIEDTSSEQ